MYSCGKCRYMNSEWDSRFSLNLFTYLASHQWVLAWGWHHSSPLLAVYCESARLRLWHANILEVPLHSLVPSRPNAPAKISLVSCSQLHPFSSCARAILISFAWPLVTLGPDVISFGYLHFLLYRSIWCPLLRLSSSPWMRQVSFPLFS